MPTEKCSFRTRLLSKLCFCSESHAYRKFPDYRKKAIPSKTSLIFSFCSVLRVTEVTEKSSFRASLSCTSKFGVCPDRSGTLFYAWTSAFDVKHGLLWTMFRFGNWFVNEVVACSVPESGRNFNHSHGGFGFLPVRGGQERRKGNY